jgi:hypothetical protein
MSRKAKYMDNTWGLNISFHFSVTKKGGYAGVSEVRGAHVQQSQKRGAEAKCRGLFLAAEMWGMNAQPMQDFSGEGCRETLNPEPWVACVQQCRQERGGKEISEA